jgi:hypothetical protein
MTDKRKFPVQQMAGEYIAFALFLCEIRLGQQQFSLPPPEQNGDPKPQ